MTGNLWIRKFPRHDFLKISEYLLNNMGEALRKFSKNQFMEIYGKYLRIRNFPVVLKKIYGSVSEAGELGLRIFTVLLVSKQSKEKPNILDI